MTAITVGERPTYDVTTLIDVVTRFEGGTLSFAGARNALIPTLRLYWISAKSDAASDNVIVEKARI